MESLVAGVLSPFLNNIIKDFSKDMLAIQALKGTAQVKDFELKGEALQELLLLPTNLEIITAKCSELDINITLTSSKKPIVLTLGRIDVIVSEPDVVKPMPRTLNRGSGKGKEAASQFQMVRGMRVLISDVHLVVQTRGINTFHPDWVPRLVLDLKDLSVETANESWEVKQNVKEAQFSRDSCDYLHKLVDIGSATVSVKMSDDDAGHAIVNKLPVQLRFATKFSSKTQEWVGSDIRLIVQNVRLVWDQEMWQQMCDLFLSLQAALRRDIPKHEGVLEGDTLDASTKRISYGVNVTNWAIEMTKDGDGGFAFFGDDLEIALSPEAKTSYLVKDLKYTGADTHIECWESKLVLRMRSLSFTERNPPSGKTFIRLISQQHESEMDVENPYKGTYDDLLRCNVSYRRKIADVPLKHRVPGLELDAHVHGLQIVLDRNVWKDLYSFVVDGPIEGGIEQGALAVRGKIQSTDISSVKAKAESAATQTIVFNVTATECSAVFPNEDSPTNTSAAAIRNKALIGRLGKIKLTNQPDWPFPPFLKDALATLPIARDALTPEEGTIHKFEAGIHRLTLHMISIDDKDDGKPSSTTALLQPISLSVYGRYFPPGRGSASDDDDDDGDGDQHALELTLHSKELRGRMTRDQLDFFVYTIFVLKDWLWDLKDEEGARRQVKKLMKAAASGSESLKGAEAALDGLREKSTDMTLEGVKQLVKDNVDTGAKIITKSARFALEKFRICVFARIEKCVVQYPNANSLLPGYKDSLDALFTKRHPLEEEEKMITDVQFERFELVLDNNITSQSLVCKLQSWESYGISHDSLPVDVEITPLSDKRTMDHNLEVKYHRDCTPGKDQDTKLLAKLSGVQITGVLKDDAVDRTIHDLVPAIRKLATEAATRYTSRVVESVKTVAGHSEGALDVLTKGVQLARTSAGEVVDGGLKGLNLSWELEVCDCEVRYVNACPEAKSSSDDGDRSSYVPRGVLKISSSSDESSGGSSKDGDLEDQLIQAKISLAMAQSEKVEGEQEKEKILVKMKKLQDEMKELQEVLVASKMSVAELQAENDNLKSTMKKQEVAAKKAIAAAKKASGKAPERKGFFSRK